jgi:hypothetical protein
MISYWFEPEDRAQCRPDRLSASALWHHVIPLHEPDVRPSPGDLFVVGFDPEAGRAVKRHLYGFSALGADALRVVDCGYVTQGDPQAVIPALEELKATGGIVLLMDPPQGLVRYQLAGARMVSVIRESNLDDDVHLRGAGPSAMIQYIGTQRHLVTEAGGSVEGHIRLSELKADPTLAEPCLRDSNAVLFSADSLHAAEVGRLLGRSSAGLSGIEACQLFRYAGAAQHMRTVGIYGFSVAGDPHGLLANQLAQMIWYLLEGSMLREDPEKSRLIEYHVDIKDAEQTLVFYKSEMSGRWWVRDRAGRKTACGYQDYRRACEADYSDVILRSLMA